MLLHYLVKCSHWNRSTFYKFMPETKGCSFWLTVYNKKKCGKFTITVLQQFID